MSCWAKSMKLKRWAKGKEKKTLWADHFLSWRSTRRRNKCEMKKNITPEIISNVRIYKVTCTGLWGHVFGRIQSRNQGTETQGNFAQRQLNRVHSKKLATRHIWWKRIVLDANQCRNRSVFVGLQCKFYERNSGKHVLKTEEWNCVVKLETEIRGIKLGTEWVKWRKEVDLKKEDGLKRKKVEEKRIHFKVHQCAKDPIPGFCFRGFNDCVFF